MANLLQQTSMQFDTYTTFNVQSVHTNKTTIEVKLKSACSQTDIHKFTLVVRQTNRVDL